jgi:4'-phosphopantetheinyl transferase EntD
MPLLLSKQINPYSAYAVWHITETEDQLTGLINETSRHTNPNKKSEWIVTRILIKYLCNLFEVNYNGIENTPVGKPILINSNAEISISHSFPMAACLINVRKPCGIDIELPRQKLTYVKKKFLNPQENSDKLGDLTKIWTAKEVLFKVYGDKELSFKNEMLIKFKTEERATGLILKNGLESSHEIMFESLFNYTLAYSI